VTDQAADCIHTLPEPAKAKASVGDGKQLVAVCRINALWRLQCCASAVCGFREGDRGGKGAKGIKRKSRRGPRRTTAFERMRRDRRTAAADACDAHHRGKNAYGLNAMREMFGTDIANKVADWLSYGEPAEDVLETSRFRESEAGTKDNVGRGADTQQPQEIKPLIQSSARFTENYVPPDYLIDGLLQRRYCYSLTAPTGTGKTALESQCCAGGRTACSTDADQVRAQVETVFQGR
jgi:hypothetical protein